MGKTSLVVITALFVITATILNIGGSFGDFSEIARWRVPSTDPVGAVGHGAILDAEGREIDPSPDFMLDVQRFYLKKLYLQADERQRAELNAKHQRLQETGRLTQREQIFVNAALIDWLIETVKPEDAAHLLIRNNVLRNRFFESDPDTPRTLIERLGQAGLIKPLSATSAGGREYIAECDRAGVPIPPDWGTPAWTSRGALPRTFISQGPVAEVFSFENERGVCLALPRWSGNTAGLLGIICLARETGNSCFWDNWDKNIGKAFPITKGSTVPLSKFGGGADLINGNGVCTDCHAGENPFVVHPATPLDMGPQLIPKIWSNPLVDPSWPQNDGPTTVLNSIALSPGEGSCLMCHASERRFPEVSTELKDYCATILASAYGKVKGVQATMPPGNVGNPQYTKHYNALTEACTRPPNRPIRVVINGATQSTPGSSRSDTTWDLGPCTDPNNCPPGFCYWRTLHGPFWQTSDASIPLGAANYRGSFLRIYAEAGKWKADAFSDPTGLSPNAPPGGTVECTPFHQMSNVPNPASCFASLWAVADPKGTNLSVSVDATAPGGITANLLTGYIGNVAQSNTPSPDLLRVFEQSGKVTLAARHSSTPLPPFQLGPLTGESWINGCPGWTPQFVAKDILSESDVQLVPYPQSRTVRCFITGITGAWSSTRNNATVQPFAEIYDGAAKDVRLRVSPAGDSRDRVGAYASCISIK
jgi:hypothetical protein